MSDGQDVLIGGIMEHIEQAGVHSGDSGCSLPPNGLSAEIQEELRVQTRKLAKALNVVGSHEHSVRHPERRDLYPRGQSARLAHRALRVQGHGHSALAKVAARVMTGKSLAAQNQTVERIPPYYSVKEAVFPFNQVSGSGSDFGPRNEVHRGGHGHGPHLR